MAPDTRKELAGLRIGFLGSGTLDFLSDAMAGSGIRHGLDVKAQVATFNAHASVGFGVDPGIDGDLDIVVLMLDDGALAPPPEILDEASHRAALASARQSLVRTIKGLRDRFACPIVVATLPIDPALGAQSGDREVIGSRLGFAADAGAELRRISQEEGAFLWDVQLLAERVGTANWHNPVDRLLASAPFALSLVPLVADSLCAFIAALVGKSRRVLVLDLDNTIWGGLVGEDGVEGIEIGVGTPLGSAFAAFQQAALALRDRGIILAACSKNDDSVVRSAFAEHPGMVLREADFAVIVANWNDKASNLRFISETLHLGLDSMVFLDDSRVERAHIRYEMPEVMVPQLPEDPALYSHHLTLPCFFDNPRLNPEDINRSRVFSQQVATAASSSMGYDEYLQSLQSIVTIARFGRQSRSRVAQLFQKSNQFNLTTRRYTEADIASFEQGAAIGVQFTLADVFGDSGIVSLAVFRKLDDILYIDSWVMSCRVLKRSIEHVVLDEAFRVAALLGCKSVVGHYRPTGRNGMVQHHYPALGFAPYAGTLPGITLSPEDMLWRRDVATFTNTCRDDLIAVRLDMEADA